MMRKGAKCLLSYLSILRDLKIAISFMVQRLIDLSSIFDRSTLSEILDAMASAMHLKKAKVRETRCRRSITHAKRTSFLPFLEQMSPGQLLNRKISFSQPSDQYTCCETMSDLARKLPPSVRCP